MTDLNFAEIDLYELLEIEFDSSTNDVSNSRSFLCRFH